MGWTVAGQDQTAAVQLLRHETDVRQQTRRLRLVRERKQTEARPLVEEIFAIFDADGDGKLCKQEYETYLHAITAWGKDWYTETKWEASWPDECKQLQSTTEGITHEGFGSVLYGTYRLGNVQQDLDKCREWARMPEQERQSHCDKTCMRAFHTTHDGFLCNRCGATVADGARMHGCRRCDFDVCEDCNQREQSELPAE